MSGKVICIGRQYGSGGREIGQKLADKLKIPYYDKLLIQKAAQEAGLDERVVAQGEEKPVRFALSGNVFADEAGMMTSFYSPSQAVFEAEREIIQSIAEQGSCVVIGRCASALLPKESTLSVFIYADDADRIARVAKRNAITEKEAKQRIRRMDRMRRQYFDFYSDSAWGAPESYSLMLSSSIYGINGCADILTCSVNTVEKRDVHE